MPLPHHPHLIPIDYFDYFCPNLNRPWMHYKRILLKLSGEALMGDQKYGIDPKRLAEYADEIKTVVDKGVEVAIVLGGGNILRGLPGAGPGLDRVRGVRTGMLGRGSRGQGRR